MDARHYDVVVVGDFRFPGGTSSAIAEELRAQVAAGYRTGLVALKGPLLRYPHPFHPGIRACLDEGLVEWLDPAGPITAGLAIAHHPALFSLPPRHGLALDAAARLLVAHQPPFDAGGQPAYDIAAVNAHAAGFLGGPITWAPIGPVVRAQLAGADQPPQLTATDWHNILDASRWGQPRGRLLDARPIIGRHSRPDPLKWPDDRARILEVYPDDPAIPVKILGGGPFLRELVGLYPSNWQVWPFNAMPPERFLEQLDVFVYYHHSRWVEAFGRTIIEAMASGAPVLLDPTKAELFGEGALYAEPGEALARVRALCANRVAYRRQSELGHRVVQARFGPQVHAERLRQLIGPPAASRPMLPGARQSKRVLMITSNGVGMGHVTRMLAVARRCPSGIEPVFLTMSQALRVIAEQGYLAEFLPFHGYLQVDQGRWSQYLREELHEVLAFYDPAVVVFDGNVPYQGLVGAMAGHPEPYYIWCRRGLWRPGAGAEVIERERHFDAVIEPGDLAGSSDEGLTARFRERTRKLAPMRLLDDQDLLPRDVARAELGLAPDRPAALILLGAGNNFDFESLRKAAVHRLEQQHGAQICIADWLIKDRLVDEADPDHHRIRLSSFPFSRHFHAFDLVISAVGYNSFHEILYAGIPVIFVPNEHPHTDDQLARARFAERHHFGLCVRVDDVYRLSAAIDRLLDPVERAALAARRPRLDPQNGAAEAARFIEEMAFSRRMDRR